MQTALEKLITIIRLVHEAAPDMPITVHFEGEARGKGYVVDLTLAWSATAEALALSELSFIPEMMTISAGGGPVEVRSCAKFVVDLLKTIAQPIHAPEHLAMLRAAKKHAPEFGDLPPGERLTQWRTWAATATGVDEASTADAHLRQLLDERRDIPNEAAPFLAVLARVHEVFVNLAPGRAGRLGGAWHLFNAGWRAEMTVDDAHRLLDRQREWRDIDQWRAWAVSLTRCGADQPDADLRRYISERIETLKGLVEEYRKARQAELVAELCRRRETEHS